jgi:outer membrane protein OmpA-like peptidoglycan-associated protein
VIIHFVFDRPRVGEGLGALNSSLTSAGQASLKDLIAQLKANPTWKVQLVGRASPEGTEDYNMRLGKRRAQLVADAVRDAGIDGSRIADAPGSSLPKGCETAGTGLKSCGEIGSKDEKDRQVAATLFAP